MDLSGEMLSGLMKRKLRGHQKFKLYVSTPRATTVCTLWFWRYDLDLVGPVQSRRMSQIPATMMMATWTFIHSFIHLPSLYPTKGLITYFLMIEFLIDSPSSRSASLAMNSSLFPDWSTPTKSLCSAGEGGGSHNSRCYQQVTHPAVLYNYASSKTSQSNVSATCYISLRSAFPVTCLFLALLAGDCLCEFVGFAH